MTLPPKLRRRLCKALGRRLLAVSFGSGVDSTAMLVALKLAGLRPDVVTFADTGGEKPETLEHIVRMNAVRATWSWPTIIVCRKTPLASTRYTDLYGPLCRLTREEEARQPGLPGF